MVRRDRVASVVLALVLTVQAPLGHSADNGNTVATGGYMGVQLEPIAGGLRVVTVSPGSPASNAGVVPGDVITSAGGGPVGSADTFTLSVRSAGAGAHYPLVITHGTQRRTLNVTLAAVPRMGLTLGAPPPVLVAQVVTGAGPGDLEQLRGRVVLLDFWASWCGPCRMVMPLLNRMHQQFAAQGLSVLGVTDESAQIAQQVGLQLSIGYTLATEPSAAARFGVRGLPTLVVIDRRGNVRHVAVGVDADEMRQVDRLVHQLLAEPATP